MQHTQESYCLLGLPDLLKYTEWQMASGTPLAWNICTSEDRMLQQLHKVKVVIRELALDDTKCLCELVESSEDLAWLACVKLYPKRLGGQKKVTVDNISLCTALVAIC